MQNDGKQLTAVEEVLESSRYAEDVIDLISQGLGPGQIAKRLACSYGTVKRLINKFYAAYSFELQERAEMLKIQTLIRLDYMYNRAAPYAFPMAADDPANPLRRIKEDGTLVEEFYPGNTVLMGIMLRVLKEQRAWYESEREASRYDDTKAVNIERMEVTIRQNSDLYNAALHSMQDDWMNPYLEMDVDMIYLEDHERTQDVEDFDEKLRLIEEKLPKNEDFDAKMQEIDDDDD